MLRDLLKATTEKLGYGPLLTVSSTSREVTGNSNKAAQAIIPSVLVGFLNLTDSDKGLETILNYNGNDWASVLFNNKKDEALNNIARYSGLEEEQLTREINNTAKTALGIVKESVKDPTNKDSIKSYLKDQRNVILNHLPASLDMGSLLKNAVIDDYTTKMQGPFSTVMHKITESFDKNETDEDLDKKSKNF